jgi:hypothetical protein
MRAQNDTGGESGGNLIVLTIPGLIPKRRQFVIEFEGALPDGSGVRGAES